jgi:hypothetical protein
MKKIDILPEWLPIAEQKAKTLGKLRNSITDGEGNIASVLGEMAVNCFLKGSIWQPTFDYDIIYRKKTADAKSKRHGVGRDPTLDDEGSIYAKNMTQKCDAYIFTRVQWEKESSDIGKWVSGINGVGKYVWIMGIIAKENFISKARHIPLGWRDSSNGWVCKEECWNIFYRDLIQII